MTDAEDVKKLMDDYWQWMRDRTVLKEVKSGLCEISTPFLDRHNDGFQIYAKKDGGEIILSDDGYTIRDLKYSGWSINTPKKKELIERILNINGVEREKDRDELSVRTSAADFPSRKSDLINAMMQINDLYVTSRSNITSLFLDDVGDWLVEKGQFPSKTVKLKGISKVDFQVDFLIPPTKTANEKAMQAVNRPTMESLAMANLLAKELSQRKTEVHLMLNDKNVSESVMNKITSVAKTNGVFVHMWSKKETACL